MLLKSLTFHCKSVFSYSTSFLVANNKAIYNALLMNVALHNNWNDRNVFAKFKLSVLAPEAREALFIWATSDHNFCWWLSSLFAIVGHHLTAQFCLECPHCPDTKKSPVYRGIWYSYQRCLEIIFSLKITVYLVLTVFRDTLLCSSLCVLYFILFVLYYVLF